MSGSAKHICLLCSRLDLPGGIERAVVNTANLFAENGHQVTLLQLDEATASFFPIHKNVQLISSALDFGIGDQGNFLSRKIRLLFHLEQLRKLISSIKPDVVIGSEYQFSIAVKLAVREKSIRIYAWEHHHFHWLEKSFFWRNLTRWIYPQLNAILCLNPTEAALYKEAGCKTMVIPNFIELAKASPLTAKTILSIGWLIPRKGFDYILAIAPNIFKHFPDWKWKIVGDGEMKVSLQKKIVRFGLASNIEIVSPSGPQVNELYQQASVYVMTSRFECFPMVLLEAAANGVPAVAFDCPTGPAFIINNGVDGCLVPEGTTQMMKACLLELLSNEEKRISFGKAAKKNAERFAPHKIYALWKELFANTSTD